MLAINKHLPRSSLLSPLLPQQKFKEDIAKLTYSSSQRETHLSVLWPILTYILGLQD